jgi:hypothetical protein
MLKDFFRLILPMIAVLHFSSVGLAQNQPDLSGVWWLTARSNTFDMKEAPSMRPWAEVKFKETKHELDPLLSCFPPGVPRVWLQPRPFEIIQIPGRVLILYEGDHWVRQIWMNERHPDDPDPTWMGHSIGAWDGDTLVIDTIGLNDSPDTTWLDSEGRPHSEELHVIERIQRTAPDTLTIQVTINDTKTYTKPWSGEKVFKLRGDWKIMEDVNCIERLRLTPWSPEVEK